MHKLLKHKDNIKKYILFNIILIVTFCIIIYINIYYYACDLLLSPYILYILLLIIYIFKEKNKKFVMVNLVITLIFFIFTLAFKPNYTVNQARAIIENDFHTKAIISYENLGYPKRKNIISRGFYTYITEDNKLIIFDNESGKFKQI